MEERYIACIIIAHGAFLTSINETYNDKTLSKIGFRFSHKGGIRFTNKRKTRTANKRGSINSSVIKYDPGIRFKRERENITTNKRGTRTVFQPQRGIRFTHEEEEKRKRPIEMRIMPKIVDLPINITMCNFPVPTEECIYIAEEFINLKDRLISRFEEHESMNNNVINDEIFKYVVEASQKDSGAIGFQYRDETWAPNYTKRPEYTEQWITGSKCIDKFFRGCSEFGIQCGIYIVQNNVGIKNGSMIPFNNNDRILLSELIEDFSRNYQLNKMYILDTSCSIVANPEMNEAIEDRQILNNIFNHAVMMMSEIKPSMRGGKKRKRKNKTIKNKSIKK